MSQNNETAAVLETAWRAYCAAPTHRDCGRSKVDAAVLAALEAQQTDGIESALASAEPVAFDFAAHLARQAAWSARTFGPGSRAAGVVDHIRKELTEIEADPGDLKEWIDVVILALDGAWRSGATPAEIVAALAAKQEKNEGRSWPDWRTADPSKAIEHDRSKDTHAQPAAKVEAPRSDSDIADAISGLEEAYRFASTSPRAQEAINFAIEVMGRTASPTPASVPDGCHVIRYNGDGEFGQKVGWLYRTGGDPCVISWKPVYVWRPIAELLETTA